MHGHNGILDVTVEGSVPLETGMVYNFTDLKAIVKNYIEDKYDHQNMNRFLKLTTAENIVRLFWKELEGKLPKGVKLSKMVFYETGNSSVEFDGK